MTRVSPGTDPVGRDLGPRSMNPSNKADLKNRGPGERQRAHVSFLSYISDPPNDLESATPFLLFPLPPSLPPTHTTHTLRESNLRVCNKQPSPRGSYRAWRMGGGERRAFLGGSDQSASGERLTSSSEGARCRWRLRCCC